MSDEIKFFVIVGYDKLDGVFVRGVYKDWHKAMQKRGEDPDNLRVRTFSTFIENM